MHLATLIRGCIRMKIVCAGRVNFDFVQEFLICQPLVKDSFCGGTSTNIAHADKKNAVAREGRSAHGPYLNRKHVTFPGIQPPGLGAMLSTGLGSPLRCAGLGFLFSF